MWKPGTEKPKAHDREDDANRKNSISSSTPRKRLSGATMNMRFMQRSKGLNQQQQGQQQQKNHRQQQQQKKEQQEKRRSNEKHMDNDMDVDFCESDSKQQQRQQQHVLPLQNEHHQKQQQGGDLDVVSGTANKSAAAVVATASDMYGIQSDLVGRRSFGGFNRAMEHAWDSSYRVLKGGSMQQENIMKDHLSDDELLKRYKDLVDNRGSGGEGGNDDIYRRRQGHQQKKARGKSHSPPQRRQGEKRKRNSISNV